jgi:hypothetical protein
MITVLNYCNLDLGVKSNITSTKARFLAIFSSKRFGKYRSKRAFLIIILYIIGGQKKLKKSLEKRLG